MSHVSIVDYGIGNLLSVKRAFEHIGTKVDFVETASQLKQAGHLVLPGVGAFGKCAERIETRDLWQPISDHAAAGKPFLGICVGMQLMLSGSKEFGSFEGFGFIPGIVERLPQQITKHHKIPQIGWKKIQSEADDSILAEFDESHFYFIHSYQAKPTDELNVFSTYQFGQSRVTACLGRENLLGTQFHPEKSGPEGLRLLQRFMDAY